MVKPVELRRPVMVIGALSTKLGRTVSAVRSDLYWRFTRPGGFRRRFEHAVTNMSHGVCLYDAQDRLQLVNEQFCQIYHQPMSTLRVGMRFRDILANSIAVGNYPGQTTDAVWRKRKAFIDQRQPGTFLQELGNGRLIAISHQPLQDGGWVATYEDITERRRAEMQIKFMAHHDALTQLPNRLLFGERLEQALAAARQGGSCALICLDLDGFKLVNDQLSHAAGDMLLRQVADRLQLGLRDDDIAARLGGDEFAVLLPATGAAEALNVAKRIGGALRCEYDLGSSGPARIGVSIGVACAPDHADAADTLLSYADNALYMAKHTGLAVPRLYDARLPGRAIQQRAAVARDCDSQAPRDGLGALRVAASMVNDLRAALQSGRVHLEYQPVCDCATTDVVAYEALLRWTDPIRGSVPPSEFIPAAEESGFIVQLSEWVLRQACAEAASWGSPAAIGVNLSPLNFSQPDLVGTIISILVETDLPPERLIIEVTEGLLLDQSPAVQGRIQELRALGIQLWLDDFGSGYANFATLRSFPFSSIKIDRSFLAEGPPGGMILGAIIALGKACGLEVVVEGVETTEQLGLLRSFGCDRVQGYLLGRPMRTGQLFDTNPQNVRTQALGE